MYNQAPRDQAVFEYDLPTEFGDDFRVKSEIEFTVCVNLFGFTDPSCRFDSKAPSIEFYSDPADFAIRYGPQIVSWEHNDRVTSFVMKALLMRVREAFKSMPVLRVKFVFIRPTVNTPAVVYSAFSALYGFNGLYNKRLIREIRD